MLRVKFVRRVPPAERWGLRTAWRQGWRYRLLLWGGIAGLLVLSLLLGGLR